MIDFYLLKKLINSARNPDDGKPLDSVRFLGSHSLRYGPPSGMRNCRLFRVNDSNWRVALHGNTIARITRLDDGTAHVTISSVNNWPTMTTAERLRSVLGFNIWKQDNKLRGNFQNVSHSTPKGENRSFRQYPPLVDGQTFHLTASGAVCINPEIVAETRTRVRNEPAKPVLAYLRNIKKIANALAKVGSLTYKDLQFINGPKLPMSLETPVDADLALRVMAVGANKRMHAWDVNRFAQAGRELTAGTALGYLEAGLRHYKDCLYATHGVYENYQHSFMDHFTKVQDGRYAPLAQAA